jgi:glycosyltransferase involved in cell wall biosynthesis
MKEVYIISTGEIVNGKTAGARRMVNIASSLAAVNVNVFLCSLSEVDQAPVEIPEVKHGVYFMRSLSHTGKKEKNPLSFVRTVNSFMAQRDSEIVIYLYPTVFVLKDFFYLVYFKFLKRRRFFCEINELRAASAFYGTPHGGPLAWFLYYLKSSINYFIYKLNEFQVFLYDGIVVISTSLERYFSNYTCKILKVPILCDADLIDVFTPPRLEQDSPFKICFAGYIKIEKEGFDILFDALFRVNRDYRTELFLYGILEDTDRIKLEKLSDEHCLHDKVFYMGNIEPERLLNEFRKYNLLILPRPLKKTTMYGFSTKLSEYLVSGIPVLVTDVSDNTLYIRDGFNGYIIPPGSASSMAEKILEIISDFNDQAETLVENAHQTVRENFDYRLFSRDYVDFFWSQGKTTGFA